MNTIQNKTKDRFKGQLGFKIHFLVYFLVNLVLLIINAATGFGYLWAMWPIAGWGIAILIHLGVVISINKLDSGIKKGLFVHAVSFLSLNLGLFIFNLLTGMQNLWCIWVLFGTFPAIAIHFGVFLALQRKNLYGKKHMSVRIHLAVYLSINLMLLGMNILTFSRNLWVFWPALSWLVALGVHASVIYACKKYKNGLRRSVLISGFSILALALYVVMIDLFTGHGIKWSHYVVIPLVVGWFEHLLSYRFYRIRNLDADEKPESRFLSKVGSIVGKIKTKTPLKSARTYISNKFAFRIHLSYYLIINAFLIIVNMITSNIISNPWCLWVIFSWAIAVVYHLGSLLLLRTFFFGKSPNLLLILPELSIGLVYFAFENWIEVRPLPYRIIGFISMIFLATVTYLGKLVWIKAAKTRDEKMVSFIGITPSSSPNNQPAQVDILIETEPNNSDAIARYCPSCGGKYDINDSFCEICGQKLR